MPILILETWKLCAYPLPDFPDCGTYSLLCRQYFTGDQIAEAYDLLANLRHFDNNKYLKYSLTEIQEDGTTTTY